MRIHNCIVFIISIIRLSFAGVIDVLPVEKCKLSDSECLKREFQKALPIFMKGIPEIGIDVMDVLKMDDLSYEVGGLSLSLRQGTVAGISKAIIDNVEWNTQEKYFTATYHVDSVLEGHYVASGKVITMPLKGDGHLSLELKDAQVTWMIHYDLQKGSDGKEYAIPKDYDISYDVRQGATFVLTNLFDGNKELSDSVLSFLNKNWKKVVNELGKPIVKAGAFVMYKNIKTFLKKYPISDIAEY